MEDMDDILSEENATSEETVAEQTEPVEERGQPRDESGKFAAKGETESASPAPVEEPPLEHPALLGERRRRQEAEEKLQAYEQRLKAIEEQKPDEPAPSIWEDDEAWQQNFGKQLVGQAVEQATSQSQIRMSEMMMRQQFPDFDEVREQYLALERENPSIIPQVMNDPHPWHKAYTLAKNHSSMQELGATNLEELKAKLREELAAEAAQKPAPQIPSSLADSQSSRAPQRGSAGPISLDDILNG